jgi:hypothetical protein
MKSSEEYGARVSLSGKMEEAGLEQKPGEPVKLKRPRIAGGTGSEPVVTNFDLPEDDNAPDGAGGGSFAEGNF